MTDPVRLREGAEDTLVRALLDSANDDRSAADGAQRALIALGTAASAVAAASSAGASTSGGTGATSAIGTTHGAGGTLLSAGGATGATGSAAAGVGAVATSAKLAAVVLTLAVGAGAVASLRGVPTRAAETTGHHATVAPTEARATDLPRRAPNRAEAAREGSAKEADEASSSRALAATSEGSPEATAGRQNAASRAVHVPKTDDLSAEVALVDRARSALRHGELTQVDAAVREHERRFPRGSLAPEVRLLRVERVAADGDRAALEREIQRYRDEAPSPIYLRRAERLLDGRGP